ncbi:uncharacterized protein LOC132464778 isoform X2 [Gadus macrocephalus]|uniref:uncharacterized protein LOC132464778 isoform X2 n=1 Tax=Gadus macrocephalus TaxID=80720 RepID=UPI0028CB2677|nr:uncharacterized protein LOC132464778 isoform X2 [Gadus macrocephalus]
MGDGRMDSPGFCAQYCTYTAMDNDSKKIMSIVNLDKRETNRNSVAMEKEGFIRTIDDLRKDVEVQEVCTDGHLGIKALFSKGMYKDIGVVHCLDIWHGSKNLSKKFVAAGQQKSCSILLQWDRDICNHFWYCCKIAGTYYEFFDMWVGLLHHVTGEHEWALGACRHCPLVDSREKDWIVKNSPAQQKLREIIMDIRWLKNFSPSGQQQNWSHSTTTYSCTLASATASHHKGIKLGHCWLAWIIITIFTDRPREDKTAQYKHHPAAKADCSGGVGTVQTLKTRRSTQAGSPIWYPCPKC